MVQFSGLQSTRCPIVTTRAIYRADARSGRCLLPNLVAVLLGTAIAYQRRPRGWANHDLVEVHNLGGASYWYLRGVFGKEEMLEANEIFRHHLQGSRSHTQYTNCQGGDCNDRNVILSRHSNLADGTKSFIRPFQSYNRSYCNCG
jgi:hypothetical protein